MEILVRFLVAENPLGDFQQSAELNQRGHASAGGRLKCFFAESPESKRAESRLVGDAQQIVAFCESANRAALAFSETTFRSLHEATAPRVRCGVANRAESCTPGGRGESTARQGKSGLQ